MQDLAAGTRWWTALCHHTQGLFWHKRPVRPKHEAGSFVLLCFNLLFCFGRVFRQYLKKNFNSRWEEDLGGYSWGPGGESSERLFFFYQAALLSRLVAINTCHRYPGLDCTADQLVLALNFTSCSTSFTLWWLLSFQWHGKTDLPKRTTAFF